MILKRIIILFVALNLLIPPVYAGENEDKLLAVKKAYMKATGRPWDDATPQTQRRFMKVFDRAERARLRRDMAIKREKDRDEKAKFREKKNEQRQLDQMEKSYLRQK